MPGEYDEAKNWLDTTRAGNTAHIDHANVLYQIPVENDGAPIVFLHGYGQSRLGWMGTPDGRPGWSEFFLRAGHAVFLVDQPRRGEGGSSARMPGKFPDVLGEAEAKDYLPGDQAWTPRTLTESSGKSNEKTNHSHYGHFDHSGSICNGKHPDSKRTRHR